MDVGGSTTKVVVLEGGRVVDRGLEGGGNIVLDPELAGRLGALISKIRPDRAGLGLAGASNDALAGEVGRQLSRQCGIPVSAATDLTVAWIGAFLGRPGIVVVSGTGSFAIGGHRASQLHRVGGHGFLLGDEGSAYWLGREAFRAALAAHDGAGPQTVLWPLIEQELGQSLEDLVRLVHSAPSDRSVLARLAPLVAAAAQPRTEPDGTEVPADPEAWRVVDEAAGALAHMVVSLQHQLGALPVVAMGGVLAGPVGRHLGQRVPLGRPAADSALGAALMATGHDLFDPTAR